MKKLMLGLVVVFATVASQATVAVPAKVAIIASVNGSEHGLKQVAVATDKRLIITKEDGTIKQGQLSDAAFDEVKYLAMGLAEAQLTETSPRIVCAMMPRAELSDLKVSKYNILAGTVSGAQKLVLTATNCAVTFKVVPTEEHSRLQAEKLKLVLRVLGLNTVK